MQQTKVLTFLFVIEIVQIAYAADQKHAAFTCADSAGIDFQIQGEYEGTLTDDSSQKLGMQQRRSTANPTGYTNAEL